MTVFRGAGGGGGRPLGRRAGAVIVSVVVGYNAGMDDSPFLAAIRAHPDDDGPRLAYADWLDEHGDADRAEFIRVQCRRHAQTVADPFHPDAAPLMRRERELLGRHEAAWVGPLPTF